ncbi:DUF1566 domain-containing protein [Hydrogenophaga crassostreae]|uniref:Lcl C-terminal domain-containing protein n=1 Tax=Hydrogenophaga crassostreae TaxID=1763535 RepID=UPI0012FE7C95|nr:DUF1566 domain-containing protein [Hydrogenophaga crassostreae]
MLLSTSDASVANATVGGIVHIPAATGGLELPFTGRVTSVSTASGKQQIQMVPANPEDVFNEISWDIDTRRVGTKVAGVIAPKNAIASFSLAQKSVSPGGVGAQTKLAVDGSFTAANSMLNGTVTVTQPIVYKGATITLTATANVSDVALRSEAVFSKSIPDYFSTSGWGKITAVVSGKVGGQVKLEGAANDIKLADMLTSTDVWDQLKWNAGESFSLEGLDGQDKAGRIPLGGVILTTGAATAFAGNIPDSAVTLLSAAPTSVLWIYLNLDGTLSLQGETGWRAADYGFEQGVEARLVGSLLMPTLINNSTPGWQELYANGSATYSQRVGLMPAADVLIAGIRPAHINAFVGAEFNGSMKGAGEYRFLPVPRTANGAFCMQSHAWAGIELNTRFRVKAKLDAFSFKTEVGVEEQHYTGRPVTWVDEDLQPLCVTGGAFSISAVARGPDPANSANGFVDVDFTPAYSNNSIRSLTDIWRVTASCAGCTDAVFDIPATKAGLDRISLPVGKTYTLTLAALNNTYQVIKTASTNVTLVSAPSASFVVAANAGNCASLTLTATAAASSGRSILTYAWAVQRTGAAAETYSGNPVNSVLLPSCGSTQIQLTVIDSEGFTTLVSQTVDTSNLGAKVTDVTPLTATLDVPTAFTVTGTNLPLSAQLVLGAFAECQSPVNATSTGFQQTCTPRGTAGIHVMTVMTNSIANGGVLIDSTRSVAVSAEPSTRYSLVGNYTKEECVKDNTTGLIWEGKTAGGPRSGANSYTNFDDSNQLQNWTVDGIINPTQSEIDSVGNSVGYAKFVNGIVLCGFSDGGWRLPSREELASLANRNLIGSPKIDTSWFPNTTGGTWSSSPRAEYPIFAWGVDFANGDVYGGYGRVDGMAIRLVHASQ